MEQEKPEEPEARTLSDIEKRILDGQLEALKEDFAALNSRWAVLLRTLMDTGSFSERDLHLMLRGQILALGMDLPCQVGGDEDDLLDDEGRPQKRDLSQQAYQDQPLRAIPLPRHRLACPLQERGEAGDPLVPCAVAQYENPAVYERGNWRELRKLIVLPPDLPARQARALRVLLQPNEEMAPCHILHNVMCYQMMGLLDDGYPERLPVSPRPVPPPPELTAEERQDMELRLELKLRQEALEAASRLEAAEEEQRRRLLRHLLQTGRLQRHEAMELVEHMVVITDEGWLPCRDDPQRTHTPTPGEPDLDSDDWEPSDVPLSRWVCTLKLRALEGDADVPCCEAQKMLPAGAEESADPEDIVQLLHIRPCYLLGRMAASHLYTLGQHYASRPDIYRSSDEEEEAPA